MLLTLDLSCIIIDMNEVTLILNAIENGDIRAADKLLPLVYKELRKLATQRMKKEKPVRVRWKRRKTLEPVQNY